MTEPSRIEFGHPTREQLKLMLAEGQHETWMHQRKRDRGIDTPPHQRHVTDHDLERAENALEVLETLATLGIIRFEIPPVGTDLPRAPNE